MAELKTKKNEASVQKFLNTIKDGQVRNDCEEIATMMKQVTKAKPKMWGSSIVGFGEQHLVYESGRELDWMLIGFSPRKQNLTLYVTLDENLLKKLGKFTTGKGCLYIKKLADVDKKVLKEVIAASVKKTKSRG